MHQRHPYAIYDVQPCTITPGGFTLEFVTFERYNLTMEEAQAFLREVTWRKTHSRNPLHSALARKANFQLFQLTPVTELVPETV